jgi:hypothetical protein
MAMPLISRYKFVRMLAVVASVFAVSSAQGIVFKGNFDPPLYGGTVFVDVDPLCVSGGTLWIDATTCGGPVDILSLVVNATSAVDQLTFAPPTLTGEVTGLYWVSGVLTAIDTLLISPQVGLPSTGNFFNNSPNAEYGIQFFSNQQPLGSLQPPIVELRECLDGCGYFQFVGETPATQEVFVQVPEPASLALVLGAFGAGWLTRRRKAST